MQVLDGIEQGRAAHHHRAGMIGAVAVADIRGRAMEDAGDAVHRHFERIRRDLREHGLDALADRRGAHEHRDRAVAIDLEPRRLLGAGGAAFDEAADGETVMAAVDEPALQLGFRRPAEFGEATVERNLIVAAVDLVFRLERRDGRKRIRHRRRRNEVATAEFDTVDAEIGGHHVEQSLAEEVGLEAARPAIGADRGLVGHPQRRLDPDVGDR